MRKLTSLIERKKNDIDRRARQIFVYDRRMLTRNEVTNIMRLAERERDIEGKKERKKAFVEKKEKSKMESKDIYNHWRRGKERNKTI